MTKLSRVHLACNTHETVVAAFFVLLCVSAAVVDDVIGAPHAIVPAELVQGTMPGEKAYTIHLFVGTPPESLQFEVTFKTDLVIVYRNQRMHSVSYSPPAASAEGSVGSEIIYFGSRHTRFPITYDPSRALSGEHSHCATCAGMIGLGRGSPVWQVWSEASFTPASITVGAMNPLMESGGRGCTGCIVACDIGMRDDGCMCVAKGRLVNYLPTPVASETGVVSNLSFDAPIYTLKL